MGPRGPKGLSGNNGETGSQGSFGTKGDLGVRGTVQRHIIMSFFFVDLFVSLHKINLLLENKKDYWDASC